ncbi:hypothetical protein AA0112_g10684 [Alternaria arborescens]|uniref:hypothetical protein n=1 Tax=Alternaria arborescens TaxID=156630 RepID=UPI001074C9A9|nr:hypothetical protein AA0111_g5387 [Alternaria arborescens]RYN20531.1 hypothetical protein AA0112_g10684 [Alternaria arborescens]RYO30791.1 hypothetical protein AA0111_g5387 [Alternaria arborescens]
MMFTARSNLIVGEMSRLQPASKENSSYALEFFGTTLDCQTVNRSMESIVLQSSRIWNSPNTSERIWNIEYPEPDCVLKYNEESVRFSGNTSIIYRQAYYPDAPQYWPCLDGWIPHINDSEIDVTESDSIDFPGSGINVIVPVTETVCRPKIVSYHVTISNLGEPQHVSYSIEDVVPVPAYNTSFDDFTGGTFEQWAQLSDAALIYDDFARSFDQFGTTFKSYQIQNFSTTNVKMPYTIGNGTVVEACVLEGNTSGQTTPVGGENLLQEIWQLGVFEQRIHGGEMGHACPAFDSDMANELLINITISALALNKRFKIVKGTETLNFNAYRFENKLVLILPYGLSLALAIPILVLGFIALYVQNHGVSAISGGFLQLLMTTTGHTSLEAVVTKGFGTLGGYENVSEELREMEVRFGELIGVSGDDQKETDTLLSGHEEHADVQEDNRSQSGFVTTSGMERCENNVSVVQRAGFGTVDEVGLFRKKGE